MSGEKNKQIVGNAGLFFVCHQLSKMGWNVLPTSRNAKGIDIVAYREDDALHFFSVSLQVKSLSKKCNVQLGKTNDGHMADYFVVCVGEMKLDVIPECFVFTSDEAKSLTNTRVYKGKFWLQKKSLSLENKNWNKIKDKE